MIGAAAWKLERNNLTGYSGGTKFHSIKREGELAQGVGGSVKQNVKERGQPWIIYRIAFLSIICWPGEKFYKNIEPADTVLLE